ncbi:MAG: O-methyltransferase [Phycisphaerae bacterium]
MKHPPYQLKPNKAVDRFLLAETLKRLQPYLEVDSCAYYGFGGPFLDDFRLLGERFPGLRMVSIERDQKTYARQKFHLPSSSVRLLKKQLSDFLTTYSKEERSIFWLDYTDMKLARFQEFREALVRVAPPSVVKITLRARGEDWLPQSLGTHLEAEAYEKAKERRLDRFERRFDEILASGPREEDFLPARFPGLVQRMLRIACEKALPAQTGVVFQILSSCTYSDRTQMLSVTGLVCPEDDLGDAKACMEGWKFANLEWGDPKNVDVPNLSIKERLSLESLLPCTADAGKLLRKAIGYDIGDSRAKSERGLQQYADFYEYYPQFAKVMF